MEIFFTADCHFDHKSIVKLSNRPFKDVNDMNEKLIENWNSIVSKKDQVIIVGDFAFGRHGYFINALNGKKHLVIGSHDKMPTKYMNCFSSVKQINFFTHNGRDFVCSHCPFRVWEGSHYGSIQISGHVHGRVNYFNLTFDVGVDCHENNYFPISMDEIMKRVKIRESEMEKSGRIKMEERERNGKKYIKKMYYQDDLCYFKPDVARNKIARRTDCI